MCYITPQTIVRLKCHRNRYQKYIFAHASRAVSYEQPYPDEPLGKDHPELLTKLKPSPNHGHDQAIVNGISRIDYMKGGKHALWEDENIADSITLRAVRFIDIQLYNLRQDLGEKENVAGKYPEIVERLKNILEMERNK